MENKQIFDLCSEGEQVIKSYECTRVKKLFFGTSKGNLTLTNKRVIYHSTGKSIKGRSVVLNEMPIDDVSGVSTYIGTSINWLGLVIFVVVLYLIVTPLVFRGFPRFLTSQAFGIIALIPYSVLWIWNKNVISSEMKRNVLDNLKDISENEYVKKIKTDTAKKASFYLFAYGIYILGMHILTGKALPLIILLYIAIYFMFFGTSRVFSLLVFSKSAKGAVISLSGVQQFFKTNETTALDTMSGAPAKDSETVIRELGAIITDLKQMGDLAIAKWQ